MTSIKSRLAGLTAFALVVAGLATGLLTAPEAQAASDLETGLVAWYELDETSGTTAVDSSGHGRNGTVTGTASWNGGDGFTFSGGSSSTGNAIQLPDNLLAGLGSVTVDFDVRVDPTLGGNWFMFNLGNTATYPNGTGYLFVTGKDASSRYRGTMAAAGFPSEQSASRAGGLATGLWKHVTLAITGGTVAAPGSSQLYEDGVLVASSASITATPAQIGEPDGTSTRNFIGRSAYPADNSFKGAIRDFRIYDRALDADDAAALSAATSTAAVTADTAALTLGDTSAVTADLALPATGASGTTIAWTSSDPAVVAANGAVTRPAFGQPDASVTLTATVTRGRVSDTRLFPVTVLADEADDGSKVQAAVDAVELVDADAVRGNLTLPTSGLSDTAFTWDSSDPAVVTSTGEVTRPAPGAAPVDVSLTVTGTLRQATATRTFDLTVLPLPAPADYEAYTFAYFAGESTDDGEKIYFGASHGDDPRHWDELNDGEPVLTSTLGEQGLRDPFIIRSHEGDTFYLLATDLKIFGGNNFSEAQESGSKSLMVWESTDLVNWSDQRMVKVSSDYAGNTWAPEAFYDESAGEYVVYWASNLYDTTDETVRSYLTSYNRMMYATTRDFVTFSEARPWIDVKRGTGRGMIDATVVKDGNTFYRFVKDEASMTVRQEKSTDLTATVSGSLPTTTSTPGWQLVKEGIGVGQPNPWGGTFTNGEGPTVFRDNAHPGRWYMFIDQPSYHGGQGYLPFVTDDIASGNWTSLPDAELPTSPRHGTVLPVTQEELDRMRGALQPDLLVTGVDEVAVTTREGVAPQLPATVDATYGDGSSRSTPVTWEDIDSSAYAAPGTFVVEGDLDGGASVRARATVTVTDPSDPTVSLATTPGTPDGLAGWWVTSPVTVTASAQDDRQVAEVAVSVDDGPWTSSPGASAGVTVSGDGRHTVAARATDASGNASQVGTLVVRIDTTAAVSRATLDQDARTVSIRAADDESGVERVEYLLGAATQWTTYTAAVPVGTAATTLRYRAVDTAGNVEVTNSIAVPRAGNALLDSLTAAVLRQTTVKYGATADVVVRVSGAGPVPTGTVRVLSGAIEVGSGQLASGRATIAVGTRELGVGRWPLTVVYGGDAAYAGSQDTVVLRVTKAGSRTTTKLTSTSVRSSQEARVQVTVATTPAGVSPAGPVTLTVRADGTTRATVSGWVDADGRVTITLPKLKARAYTVLAVYAGSATIAGSSTSLGLRVIP